MNIHYLHIALPQLLYDLMQKGGYNMSKLIIKLLREYFQVKEEDLQ